MRKIILTLALVTFTALCFVSCGKKGTCELCGKENVSLKTYTIEGESADLCSDCYKTMDDLAKNAEKLQSSLLESADNISDDIENASKELTDQINKASEDLANELDNMSKEFENLDLSNIF